MAHPYTHISVSDGGAHTRFAVIATWATHFLAHWVRDKGLMSLEDAVVPPLLGYRMRRPHPFS